MLGFEQEPGGIADVELDSAASKSIMSFVCSGEVAFGKELSGQPSQSGSSLIVFSSTEHEITRDIGACELSRAQSETHAAKSQHKDKGKKIARNFLCGKHVINMAGHSTHSTGLTLFVRGPLLARMWFGRPVLQLIMLSGELLRCYNARRRRDALSL